MSAVHYDIVGKLESNMNSTLALLFEKLGIDPSHYKHSSRNSHNATRSSKLKIHYQVLIICSLTLTYNKKI